MCIECDFISNFFIKHACNSFYDCNGSCCMKTAKSVQYNYVYNNFEGKPKLAYFVEKQAYYREKGIPMTKHFISTSFRPCYETKYFWNLLVKIEENQWNFISLSKFYSEAFNTVTNFISMLIDVDSVRLLHYILKSHAINDMKYFCFYSKAKGSSYGFSHHIRNCYNLTF